MTQSIALSKRLATELQVQESQVIATIGLLDEGATVPFIARYRKEVTGGLDDTQLRTLSVRLVYLRELDDRKSVILKSIDEQGKLTPELEKAIQTADSKTDLEDLYLPYKPKRRTKGQIAIEAGLEPLADLLVSEDAERNQVDPETEAQGYVQADAGFADTKAVLEGARFILMERYAEDAHLLKMIRDRLWKEATIEAQLVTGKEKEGAKFRDYFEYSEAVRLVPSHRALALFRGRNEGVLQLKLNADPQQDDNIRTSQYEEVLRHYLQLTVSQSVLGAWRQQLLQWTWRIKLLPRMETDLFGTIREQAETEAIQVFATNLSDLLMAAPAGAKVTMGLDPGLRTGVKVVVLDPTGKFLAHTTIFPHAPQNHWDKSKRALATLCQLHKVELIAIGNGTGSRETDKLVTELIRENSQLTMDKLVVSEAGASVYSASELAAQEFPDLDVSLRGAVSIGRRLQDPLAELVKIEPKAIGVGQYQHDVNQSQLAQSLDAVVEDCVNAVGVELNTASAPLLARVAGLNRNLAQNIVAYRDAEGAFTQRKQLLKVPRLGPKTFEQAAGFLRVFASDNPLDASAVHPETYPVVERIAEKNNKNIHDIIGNTEFLRALRAEDYTDETFGLPTIKDIISELEKPGRDPRPEFKTAKFQEGVTTLADLKLGMTLEGVITNVTNFGAFVDIGVHQDGLVHISALTDRFVKDPHEVVKAGQIVKVKVLEVDMDRSRIALTMRLNDPVADKAERPSKPAAKQAPAKRNYSQQRSSQQRSSQQRAPQNSAMGNALAEAFANAKKK